MCGIAGILYFKDHNPANDQAMISKMTCAMSHRGPDADGFYHSGRVSLGHRRLSIIDLSETANQPFFDHSGRYVIVFNGEIYNFREIKAELKDYPFTTNGDTEVILAAYMKWKEQAFQKLKGMFSLLLWDKQENSIIAVRDRMGVKPLYYYFDEHRILFASEIRSILATGLVPAKLNRQALQDYFSFQSVSGRNTIISNLFQLDAGSMLTIDNNKPVIKKYWYISQKKSGFDFSDKAAVHTEIRNLMLQSVERRLVSDVPLGAFLSGGIDSSAVVGLMAECSPARPNTFTIGFNEPRYDESKYASEIARRFNTNHNQVSLDPAIFLTDLHAGLNAMDTPTGDGINTFIVSRAIRQSGLTVALSGIGGDELFAGYPFFKQYLQIRKFKNFWRYSGVPRNVMKGLLSLTGAKKMERVASMLGSSSTRIGRIYPEFRRVIAGSTLAKLTNLKSGEPAAVTEELERMEPALENFPDLSKVSIAEYTGYTQHTLLKDTDQMSMASSLEVREPFFDHDLVEFVLAVPDELKFPVYPKSLLVESLKGLLPDEIVHRKKQGFLFPWNLWMKNELRDFCDKHISSISKRDFVNGANLQQHWNNFLKGDAAINWMEIWLFVVLEYWLLKNKIEA